MAPEIGNREVGIVQYCSVIRLTGACAGAGGDRVVWRGIVYVWIGEVWQTGTAAVVVSHYGAYFSSAGAVFVAMRIHVGRSCGVLGTIVPATHNVTQFVCEAVIPGGATALHNGESIGFERSRHRVQKICDPAVVACLRDEYYYISKIGIAKGVDVVHNAVRTGSQADQVGTGDSAFCIVYFYKVNQADTLSYLAIEVGQIRFVNCKQYFGFDSIFAACR